MNSAYGPGLRRRIVLAQRAGSPHRLGVSAVAAELSAFVRKRAG